MTETVTVEQALKKGRWQLKHLPMIVTFGIIGGGIYLSYAKIFEGWIIPVGFVLGFLSGWLVWSYFVNQWKIWAFENVRNVHELQRKAVEEKLIWESGSWFEKTEFKNYQQKQKLKQLEKKFLEKDIFKDDISVPKETVIFYSRIAILFLLVLSLVMNISGIYFLYEKEYLGLFLLGVGVYLTYDNVKKLRDKSPQIIINAEGIKLKDEKLVKWNNIRNDRVFTEIRGKNSTTYLAFNHEKIDIGELDIKTQDLEKMLHVYRVRYENTL
ncbi:hypothetical protein SAMN06265349_10567 [Flavobacterium resistens]|uniref:Uncharacterized protein n=1 Tax=Flavobacterium resistens TaxID=443612 RepID=A0A521EL04_9FLAO|nr:hypothetical protein [Flavobacterium resistens]MRX67698.1 hypothetical protein [Flavobacterium resistens]SMO84594.1 hypothetical protein SAMN06265349_10567 [Flavobacterium resistens]